MIKLKAEKDKYKSEEEKLKFELSKLNKKISGLSNNQLNNNEFQKLKDEKHN